MAHYDGIRAAICEALIQGHSLRNICKQKGMPGKSTVMEWLAKDAEFSDQYARARTLQAETLLEEILEIADDGSRDYVSEDGRLVPDHDHIARSRLRVDTRKWAMSKLAPKKYGDSQTIKGDPENPLHVTGLDIAFRGTKTDG